MYVRTEHNNLTKSSALREARKLRNMGFNAKVVPARGNAKEYGWNVLRSPDTRK